jgi:hypothetical protein
MTSEAHAQAQLAAKLSSVMQATIQDRRAYTENLTDQLVRDGTAAGTIELSGAGESIVELAFPIRFAEKPIFTAGLEQMDCPGVQWGKFPIWSATIITFRTEPSVGGPTYVGASVAVVTFDVPRGYLHYNFAGRSYSNPVDSSTSVTQTL